MQISVSYLKSIYKKEKTIYLIEKSNADYIHVDLMDGGFVPQKNFTISEITKLLANHLLPLDIHLMVFDPLIYISDLAKLKPEYITFHIESTKDIIKTIAAIKNNNIKVGLSLKPETDLSEIYPFLSVIDLVLVMSVNPGAGGQAFQESSIKRVNDLLAFRKNNNLHYKIEIDGGINADTIKQVPKVDIAVSGSYICTSTNFNPQITNLKQSLKS